MSDLQVEINASYAPSSKVEALAQQGLLITPPIGGENDWLYRVRVSPRQAIVAFPKFGTIGIGFQVESADWNTNLPAGCDVVEIFDHIKKNRGDDRIEDATCLRAIERLQAVCFERHPDKVRRIVR